MRESRHRSSSSSTSSESAGTAPGKRALTGQLPPRVAAHAGAALGHDFSSVAVHEDGQADTLGTRAFARGDDLHFGAGAYQPDSAAGLSLIGHELAHVAQQREGRVEPTGSLGGMAVNTDSALEHEAHAAGDKVAQGFDLDGFLDFGLAPTPATSTVNAPVVQGEDLPAPEPAAATGTGAPPPAPTSPVPPEVTARVGAEFHHADDTSAERHYRITPVGGFLIISASDGKGVGTLEFRHDNAYAAAWRTLADYVTRVAATIPVTQPPAPSDDGSAPGETGAPGEEAGGALDLLGEALSAIGDAVTGIVDAGRALVGGAAHVIQDAIDLAFGAAPESGEVSGGTTPGAEEGAGEPAAGEEGATPAGPDVAPEVPGGEPIEPTTTTMNASVGVGGENAREDVILVQYRLRELGYPVNSTGTVDDATVRAIKLFQAAKVAFTAAKGKGGSLVSWIDGRIDKGATEKALFGGDAWPYAPVEQTGVKPLAGNPQAACDSATGEDRTRWDRIMAIWNLVSPYLPDGSSMSSGLRTEADQARVLEDFYTKTKAAGGYKELIIAAHGEAEWGSYVGLSDQASITVKLARVRACGQDIATPGTSPHQSGRAIDVGGAPDAAQLHGLLRYMVEVDASTVTKLLYEKNGCVHFEFAA
jgi:hypothetical protein